MTLNRIQKELALDSAELRMRQAGEWLGLEDGLIDVNSNLAIKADKATVLEQFGTFTTDLQSKADKLTLQQEVNRIKVVEDGLVDVNIEAFSPR